MPKDATGAADVAGEAVEDAFAVALADAVGVRFAVVATLPHAAVARASAITAAPRTLTTS
jgi:hypothetical protein